MKYILVGIPNSGKTTLGKRAAEALKLPFYDTDELSMEKMKPGRLHPFSLSFANQLAEVQEKVLFEIIRKDEDAIIATGAILPVDCGLSDILPKFGLVIHINRSVELARADALSRKGMVMVEVDRDGKPLPGTEINMNAKAVESYASDLPILERISHFAIENNGDIESSLERLVELIKSNHD